MSNGIIHARVDDRMLHGIVAADWVPKSKATRVMVIDEVAPDSDIIKSSIKMARPPGVSISILKADKACENFLAGKYENQKVFVICHFISDAYALYQAGVALPQLNLGNVTQNQGEVTVLDKTVRVSSEEKAMLKEMRDHGIEITAQFRPDNAVHVLTTQLD